MIQRVQTIWLLLAAIFAFLTLNLSFFSGMMPDNSYVQLTAKTNNFILILTVMIATLASVSIFLFGNRKLQLRLCIVGFLMQAGCIALYFKQVKEFVTGTYNLWAVLSFAVAILFIMAALGIKKDMKLVKSLDRLR